MQKYEDPHSGVPLSIPLAVSAIHALLATSSRDHFFIARSVARFPKTGLLLSNLNLN